MFFFGVIGGWIGISSGGGKGVVTPPLGMLLGSSSSSDPYLLLILDYGPPKCPAQRCLQKSLKSKVFGCLCSWQQVGGELHVGWAGSRHSSALLFVFLGVTPVYKELVLHVLSTL